MSPSSSQLYKNNIKAYLIRNSRYLTSNTEDVLKKSVGIKSKSQTKSINMKKVP